MDAMPMSGGGTMLLAWVPMCGQSWFGAAVSFLCMWTVMMAAMMLPSLVPVLWRYRQAVATAEGKSSALLPGLVGAGYFLVWILLGAAVYPLGATIMAVTMRHPAWARAVPMVAGLVVLAAGALQFSSWKAHHLANCRGHCRRESVECGRALAGAASAAWRHGLRLGLHCSQCCAGLTAVLLVTGIMDMPAMLAVTAGITLERLAPAGERAARVVGVVVTGAGLLLTVRAAAGLS